jgi:hypothetical protein
LITYAGLDVGRRRDRSVLTFLEGPVLSHIWVGQDLSLVDQSDTVGYAASVRHATVYCDNTGLGVGMVDLLRVKRVLVVPVNITGGGGPLRGPDGSVSIGHEMLFDLVYRFITGPKFRIDPACPHVEELKNELKGLVGTWTPTGRLHVGAKQGYDDMAFSFALAILGLVLGAI